MNSNDRRRALRMPFVAQISVTDVNSGEPRGAFTRDLSLQGCYVASLTPAKTGTKVWIKIVHAGVKFAAIGRVVHSHDKGMGIVFSKIDLRNQLHLDNWVSLLRDDSRADRAPWPPRR